MSIRSKATSIKLSTKADFTNNDSLISNHFSQQSYLEETQHEALLKSFELEYEIDKAGDKILLMNFSKKKKLSIDTSYNNNNKTKTTDEPKKSTTPTAISLSPKLELLSYEGDEELKKDASNMKKNKSVAVIKPSSNIKKGSIDSSLEKTCPNLQNLSEFLQGKLNFLKNETNDLEEYQSCHSKYHDSFKEEIEGFHTRNSSWESFNNLFAKRKMHFKKNMKKSNFEQNHEYDKNVINRGNDCFSFAPNFKTNEVFENPPQSPKIVYLHIPGYLQEEVKEQSFTPAQVSVHNKASNCLDEKQLILQELYQIPKNTRKSVQKSENKENMRFSVKSQKSNNYNSEKNSEIQGNKKCVKSNFFKKYQKKVNYFEAARIANTHIENLAKQIKNKCL